MNNTQNAESDEVSKYITHEALQYAVYWPGGELPSADQIWFDLGELYGSTLTCEALVNLVHERIRAWRGSPRYTIAAYLMRRGQPIGSP